MTLPLGLLMAALGPALTQGVKAITGKIPGWATPLLHAGIQVGGAGLATWAGVNPFGADLGATAQQAIVTQTLGHAAYERWNR